ncbi:MAG: tRNA uridine-5-carboxymethylaminomethyl(34) synthesis GTPase MnmE [Desulfobacterales bacterium]|nr:tRNA uridine-5-carboxymethylaminomethyl(34) synthesis GTPase MnmE [Desulfobacterales bacterium]
MENDTIAAIATPKGWGGIGIVKISGSDAFHIAGAVFRPGRSGSAMEETTPPSLRPEDFKSHRIRYGRVEKPPKGRIIDEVLLSTMRGPHTYTGEDVVEINGHGGPAVMRTILELVVEQGARLADPGEFTKRAFLNGRMDLTQAEAVVDVIQAKTERALQLAAAHLEGRFGTVVRRVRSVLTDLRVRLEAGIDFPEAVSEVFDRPTTSALLEKQAKRPLARLIKGFRNGRILREGLRLTVLGTPNVGKSSLMNRLLKTERVIVAPVPGTTRDLVEEALDINGVPVILTDTAGIHPTADPVERIGIQKAREAAERSDLVLFMVDGVRGATEADETIYQVVRAQPTILVINKIDLLEERAAFHVPQKWGHLEQVYLSARTGEGIDRLERAIANGLDEERRHGHGFSDVAPNLRQKDCIDRILVSVNRLMDELANGSPEEILAIDAKEAVEGLNEVLGDHLSEEILEQIFGRFCVGK